MLGFIAKKLLRSSVVINPIKKSTKTLQFTAFLSSAVDSSTLNPKVDDFTASYLINSCGLQLDVAQRVSSGFHLKPTDEPDQALNFFKRCGFTDDEIADIVSKEPTLLLADVDLSLQFKFELLGSLGVSLGNVLRLIHDCPGVLDVEDLDDVLQMLKRFLRRGEEVLSFLARFDCLSCSVVSNLVPNVAVLSDVGMPDSLVRNFLRQNGNYIALLTDSNKFKEMVDRALDMCFDPKEGSFVDAICAFSGVDGSSWERRAERFKKWEWSDEVCDMAAKMAPKLILASEKKVDKAMDYLVNYLGVKQSMVAGCLDLLEYNVDKRIITLCTVREFVDGISDMRDRLQDKNDLALTKTLNLKTEKKHFGGIGKSFDAISVEAWESKVDTFKNKWGWSHSEFVTAFRNHPRMMLVSQKKIEAILEFLVNKMGVDASIIAEHPNILKYSLEQRIIPRCSLVELLMSKGVVERKDHNVYYILRLSEESFVKLFVKKYEKLLPELMDLYSQKQIVQ